ncbi:MAG: helix-turn-helix domain-containing protein [Lachnospiraceae bacterium]|nr:helix-turn-helix domain-containing protein [Lachnospiraceae bacterium]
MNQEMTLQLFRHTEEPMHFHPEMELIYVIEGSADVKVGEWEYRPGKNDIILINSGVKHSLACGEHAILCTVCYSPKLAAEMTDSENLYFHCNSVKENDRAYDRLRQMFRRLILDEADGSRENLCLQKSLLYRLLGELMDHFLVKEAGGKGTCQVSEEDMRLQKALQYVSQNFQSSVGLSELADQMYLSVSTLSRLFKKKTGIYFADYVKQMRLRYACRELAFSSENITKIAIESGFTNLSGFNRAFRETYGISPSEYRKREQEALAPEAGREDQEDCFLEELCREYTAEMPAESQNLTVCADAKKGEDYRKVWEITVNVGAAASVLMANIQYHITFLAENLGFRYVRIWNLFSRQMKLTDGIHVGSYNFDKLDIVFDFLQKYHLFPFLDMGLKPETAVRTAVEVVYFEDESILFHSREAWEETVRAFLQHVVSRYGKEYVEQWIFETGYDPVHEKKYYESGDYDYFDTYQFLYREVKELLPRAQVGGPEGITNFKPEQIEAFLEQCKERDCIPDFVSVLLFPYLTIKSEEGISRQRISRDNYEIEELKALHEMMARAGIDSRVYVSEWNGTLSSRNYLNDSCYRGNYLINKLTEMWGWADMINVWMASDWVSNYFDVRGVANGGNGLLTKDTVCKPVYYALQFLNQLGGRLLAKGMNYIVTSNGYSEYHILCTNFKQPGEGYFLKQENIENPGEVAGIFEDSNPLNVTFLLRGIQTGRYVIKRRAVSPKEGSLLAEWRKFGYDNDLGSPEVKYIRQLCVPRLSMKKMEVAEEELQIEETLSAHEIVLLHIYPV